MDCELLSLTELFLKVGIIGAIISILSILVIPKKKNIIDGLSAITIILLILEIIGAVILLNSFDTSTVNSNEHTKVVKSNISSNNKSKSTTTKNNTSEVQKNDNSTSNTNTSISSNDKSKSTTTKNNTTIVHKNDSSTINKKNNNTESETKNTNKQYDNKKGKYYIPKFNKYVDSEQGLYDTFNNQSKAVPFDYIETETGKEVFFGPASGPSSNFN